MVRVQLHVWFERPLLGDKHVKRFGRNGLFKICSKISAISRAELDFLRTGKYALRDYMYTQTWSCSIGYMFI